MAKKAKYKKVVTPLGELFYPCLKTPEQWDGKSTGKLTIQLKPSKEDAEAFISLLEAEFETAKKSNPIFKDFKAARGTAPKLGFRELKNGDIVFKAKTFAELKNESGEVLKRTVAVFDAANKPTTEAIGNGSIGRLAISLKPQATSSSNYGIQLLLDAVQVMRFMQLGASTDASAFGFEADEDFMGAAEEDFDTAAGLPEGDVEETEGDF